MATIIPRWEWRTFNNDLAEFAETITNYGRPNIRKSEEVYILSKVRDDNTKIREDLIDIKSLQAVDENKLEQWNPTLKAGFPIGKDNLTELFKVFGVVAPEFAREEYTYEQFLSEVITPNEALKVVNVKKVRYIYSVNDCIVEFAETEFNGVPWKTACVEHVDPANVIKTVQELGLVGLENINYIKAMKKTVGLV
ncbi:hypothetical protein SRRS_14300 [Sporomusa rhizae]|uniref:hypothetical protein n=1 Tax=Sporomusa rhizae TaxID=357999 RepID=UPI00352BC05D